MGHRPYSRPNSRWGFLEYLRFPQVMLDTEPAQSSHRWGLTNAMYFSLGPRRARADPVATFPDPSGNILALLDS